MNKMQKIVFVLGLSNHARLDIRRFGSGIRIHPKVRIVSHCIYETMYLCMVYVRPYCRITGHMVASIVFWNTNGNASAVTQK